MSILVPSKRLFSFSRDPYVELAPRSPWSSKNDVWRPSSDGDDNNQLFEVSIGTTVVCDVSKVTLRGWRVLGSVLAGEDFAPFRSTSRYLVWRASMHRALFVYVPDIPRSLRDVFSPWQHW